MAGSANSHFRFVRAVLALVAVAVLILVVADLDHDGGMAMNARQGQVAQVGAIRAPDVTQTQAPETPTTICTGGSGDPAVCTSKYVTRYVEMDGGKPSERFCQLSRNVINKLCSNSRSAGECTAKVDSLVAQLTEARGDAGVESEGANCNDQYRGALTCFRLFSPPTDLLTPPADSKLQVKAPARTQAAAAVLAQASGGQLKCCKADDTQCLSQAKEALGAGSGTAPVQLASCIAGVDCPDFSQPGGSSGVNQGLTGATDTLYQDTVHGAPPPAAPADAVAAAPATPKAPVIKPSGDYTPAPAATGDGAQFTGAGVGDGNYSPYGYNQPRFQSLQTPQERARAERERAAADALRQPNVVERFAQLIGADERFSRQSPQGTTSNAQTQRDPSTAFIVRADDAHVRSIQQIARDVAQNDIPADSRVDHYARTLNVVGGPYSAGRRATSTNAAFASLQDLIVEDEAIRAMFVAEQTATREKNKVFCIENEQSADCQKRRNEVARKVERETFIRELEQRDLPDNAVEHFLAVYDGWVSPNVPIPTSTPLLLSDAPEDGVGPHETEQADGGIVSWAWDGVKNSATRMLDALRNWLTP